MMIKYSIEEWGKYNVLRWYKWFVVRLNIIWCYIRSCVYLMEILDINEVDILSNFI